MTPVGQTEQFDVLFTNHGGVAAVAVKGVRLTRINLGIMPGTFELLVVHVTSSQTSYIVATVYRPGSVTVTPLFFFTEFSDMLDRLATFAEPVLYIGDVNIHMERSTDVHTA